MSFDTRTAVAEPSAPSGSNKNRHFHDVNDRGRRKYKDNNSLVHMLSLAIMPKNYLSNGGFNYAQRQVPGTLTSITPGTAARAYKPDRWFASNEANDVQFQQVDTIVTPETGLNHRYYGKFKKITANGKVLVGQILTADATAPLRGRRVTVQVTMKRLNALTMRLGLAQLQNAGTVDTVPGYVAGAPSGTFITAWNGTGVDPTLGTNLAYISPVLASGDGGSIVGNALNCVLGTTWVTYAVRFDVPTNCKNLIVLMWSDAQLAINDEVNLSQAVLVDGVEVIDWQATLESADYDELLRFYTKSFTLATAPAQNAGLAGAVAAYAVAGAVAAIYGFRYPVPMRAVPTLTFYNPAAANALTRNTLKATDATVTTGANGSEAATMVNVTGQAAWAAGDGISIHYQADAEL